MKGLAVGFIAVHWLCTREVENCAPPPPAFALPELVHQEPPSEPFSHPAGFPAGRVLHTLYAKIQTSILRFTHQLRTSYAPLRTFTHQKVFFRSRSLLGS
jgi:hypothetical protein